MKELAKLIECICCLLLEVVLLFCTLKLSKSSPSGTRGKNLYPLSGREGLGKREKHMGCRVAGESDM